MFLNCKLDANLIILINSLTVLDRQNHKYRRDCDHCLVAGSRLSVPSGNTLDSINVVTLH